MTSSIPQSALIAERPPSVVMEIIGQSTPVECKRRVRDFDAGKSRRASIKRQSTSGTSTKMEASAGITRTLCCRRARLGSTSALAPWLLVRRRILAIGVKGYSCENARSTRSGFGSRHRLRCLVPTQSWADYDRKIEKTAEIAEFWALQYRDWRRPGLSRHLGPVFLGLLLTLPGDPSPADRHHGRYVRCRARRNRRGKSPGFGAAPRY